MLCMILIFALQAQPPVKPDVTSITKPQTTSMTPRNAGQAQPIQSTRHKTTPTLTPESDIRSSIGFVMGSQEEAVGGLKEKVITLQENREKYDRPDINDLKASRQHVEWTSSILAAVILTAISLIGYFRRFLWTSALPWLREELRGKRHPPNSDTLNLEDL